MTTSTLVIDLGSSSCRLSVIDEHGITVDDRRLALPPERGESGSGHVEWNGDALAHAVLSAAQELAAATPLSGVAITNQRTSCLLWQRSTSRALSPVLGWADGRTLDLDRQLRRENPEHAAGYSATKWRWMLDEVDPDRSRSAAREICAGTLDSWVAWVLSNGEVHCTDTSNAAFTGMLDLETVAWSQAVAERVGVPLSILPRVVEATGEHGRAVALAGAPMIRVLIGDQQASLVGQGCRDSGSCAITLGTVGAVDLVVGTTVPQVNRSVGYATVALSTGGTTSYALETSIQAAGSALAWLVRVGILPAPEQVDELVDPLQAPGPAMFVSALEGLGAPQWKFDARAAFVGLSGSDERADLVRAVLDGIACALAEVLDLIEADTSTPITRITVDGGLAQSNAMMSILAATSGRVIERPADVEATTRGAAMLALSTLGLELAEPDAATTVLPGSGHSADRAAWARAVGYVLDERQNRLRSSAPQN